MIPKLYDYKAHFQIWRCKSDDIQFFCNWISEERKKEEAFGVYDFSVNIFIFPTLTLSIVFFDYLRTCVDSIVIYQLKVQIPRRCYLLDWLIHPTKYV